MINPEDPKKSSRTIQEGFNLIRNTMNSFFRGAMDRLRTLAFQKAKIENPGNSEIPSAEKNFPENNSPLNTAIFSNSTLKPSDDLSNHINANTNNRANNKKGSLTQDRNNPTIVTGYRTTHPKKKTEAGKENPNKEEETEEAKAEKLSHEILDILGPQTPKKNKP